MDYSLQAPSKQVEGAQHPDRDGQFGYLNEQAKAHLAARSARRSPTASTIGALTRGG
jgi:Rhodopirellula transposase DDE domain